MSGEFENLFGFTVNQENARFEPENLYKLYVLVEHPEATEEEQYAARNRGNYVEPGGLRLIELNGGNVYHIKLDAKEIANELERFSAQNQDALNIAFYLRPVFVEDHDVPLDYSVTVQEAFKE